MKLSNKAYDVLKWFCILALPALSTFYAVVSKIWGLPYGTEIPETITATAVFIGALLGISHIQYQNDSDDYLKLDDDYE